MLGNRAVLLFVTLALVPVGSRSAEAQIVPSPYRFVDHKQDLGVFAGYLSTDRGAADLGPQSGWLYGLRFTLGLTGPMHLSAAASYFPTSREVIDPTGEGGARKLGEQDLDVLLITGQMQLFLTGSRAWHNLMPHVFGGLGLAVDMTGEATCTAESAQPDCSLLPSERYEFGNRLVLQLGVGVNWLPSDRIGLRFALQDNIWQLSAPDGFFTTGEEPIAPDSEWANNFEASFGLAFWF